MEGSFFACQEGAPAQLLRGGGVVLPVPVPGVVLLLGGTLGGGVVVPSGLVVPGAAPGVAVSGAVVPVPVAPPVPLVPEVAAGGAVVAGGEAVVVLSLRLLQPPSSAHTMALPRTSLLVLRSGAVMMDPFTVDGCRGKEDIARLYKLYKAGIACPN